MSNRRAVMSLVAVLVTLTASVTGFAAATAGGPAVADVQENETDTSTTTPDSTPTDTAESTPTATPKACEPGDGEPSLTQSRLYAPQKTLTSGEPGAIAGGFKVSGTANCAVVVSITMQVPSGMQIEGASDVMSGGAGIVTAQFTVKPGNVRSIRANVFSQNTGERTVTADIQYWPVGHEDMGKQIDGITLSFDVQDTVTPGAAQTQSGDDSGDSGSNSLPFSLSTVVIGVLALLLLVALVVIAGR